MKVKEIMTSGSLKHCGPDTQLQEAAKRMKTGNCGALPVVDKDHKVVGIITDRDIALSLAGSHSKPIADYMVKDVMSPRVYTVEEADDVDVVLEKMRTNQVGRLPVVNKQQQLQGIVSIHNLLNKAGKVEQLTLGDTAHKGEHISKTIKALSGRYSDLTAEAGKSSVKSTL